MTEKNGDKPYWMIRRDMKLGSTSKMGKPDSGNSDNSEPEKPEPKAKKAVPAKKKPAIKKASKKRAKEMRQYTPVRKSFLKAHPTCEIKLPGCQGQATQIHHQSGRNGKKLLDIDDFLSCCQSCHDKITEESKAAIEAGHSKTRLGKPDRGKIG